MKNVVHFPEDCRPQESPVHTFNEITTNASPAAIPGRVVVSLDR